MLTDARDAYFKRVSDVYDDLCVVWVQVWR